MELGDIAIVLLNWDNTIFDRMANMSLTAIQLLAQDLTVYGMAGLVDPKTGSANMLVTVES